GDSTYSNPILFADYSDPDVIRVGDDYYMTSSSFSHFPGLPILHSNDLVNWKLIAHAVPRYPLASFDSPQHGNGIWAPSLRYHQGEYYIYYGDPDNGIFMTKAKNPAGPWEPLKLVRAAKGWIDPCPFWDDDGSAYLVHAYARSRAGINSILTLRKMSPDGTAILADSTMLFDGRESHPTIEGPKMYKRGGYYYVFAPAGGVKSGWQTALRSRNIDGPYEDKIVLQQGSTAVNGPHQGAWVETQTGESWFIHFQDRGAYGRVVHLEPMRWSDGWHLVGEDYDGNGIGEPVGTFKKPNVGRSFPIETPQTSDEFDSVQLGLQWQWQANPQAEWLSLAARKGWLRMVSQSLPQGASNVWSLGSLLLQKFPAEEFSATTKLEFFPKSTGEKAGLIVFGLDYSYIALEQTETGTVVSQVVCANADAGQPEQLVVSNSVEAKSIFFRVTVSSGARCKFSYSLDGSNFIAMGSEFTAKPGKWVGAKVGVFAVTPYGSPSPGHADVDWLRIHP
ncbi:MAG TPA: glycoside hydrolase 43 family protein, partial [Bacteroidota bacterium]